MGMTREENREYMRRYRARKKAEAAGLPPPDEQPKRLAEGEVFRATRTELSLLPAAQVMLTSTATALALAQVLDDPTATPQKAAAAGQLRQIMTELRGAQVEKAKSPLALLRGGRAG